MRTALAWTGARALADGRFDVRLPADRGDGLGDLAGSFNALAARRDALEDERRKWVADTSHELRTLQGLAAQENLDTGERAVDSHIRNLRRKLAAVLPGQDIIASADGFW